MQHTLNKSIIFQSILSNRRPPVVQGNSRTKEDYFWYEVNLGDKKIFIPNCIKTEAVILEKVICKNNEDNQLFYCLCSRHANLKIKIRALRELERMHVLSNWTIPFLMRGLKDQHTIVQLNCKKILSTFDAREIERISYLNKDFILDITSKVINIP